MEHDDERLLQLATIWLIVYPLLALDAQHASLPVPHDGLTLHTESKRRSADGGGGSCRPYPAVALHRVHQPQPLYPLPR